MNFRIAIGYTALLFALGCTLCIPTRAALGQDADETAELIEMVVGLLQDEDADIRALAFDQIRTELSGEVATKQFADQIANVPTKAQAGLISALADRGDPAAKAAIGDLIASSTESPVRVAAIRALAKLGGPADCPKLVACLEMDAAENKAATTSLIQIQGDGVTTAIADEMQTAQPKIQVNLIEILASRRALDQIPTLLQVAVGDQSETRSAAMKALGAIASPEHVGEMVQAVLKAEAGSERSNAERNVMFVCNRISDQENRAEPILAAMQELTQEQKNTILPTLGRVGGKAAYEVVLQSIGSGTRPEYSAGLRALTSWPNASVAGDLEKLALGAPFMRDQIGALRSLIRIAPLDDGRSNEEKLDLLKKGMDLSVRYKDRNYALSRGSAIRIPETLRWVLPFVDNPQYAETACTTIVNLAHIRDLRDDNKAEFHAALDKVMATSKIAETLERADRYKKGQTWLRSK